MQLKLHGKKIWFYERPIDFRASIDGLVGLITVELKAKPQEDIYLFYNRAKDKIKCLSWHKNGFILLYKRLEAGRFSFIQELRPQKKEISIDELSWLLAGLEWQKMHQWGELNYEKFS